MILCDEEACPSPVSTYYPVVSAFPLRKENRLRLNLASEYLLSAMCVAPFFEGTCECSVSKALCLGLKAVSISILD